MTVKRCRDEHHDDIMSMGNSLYSKQGKVGGEYSDRMFECRTCNRLFTSFQALGGHRASHKKPKVMTGCHNHLFSASPPKPKTHDCSICGLEFAIGQALGGHMRRHKTVNNKNVQPLLSLSLSLKSQSPIVKKSNSMRVLFLDLNLTPSENKFLFGKILNAPVLDCFF